MTDIAPTGTSGFQIESFDRAPAWRRLMDGTRLTDASVGFALVILWALAHPYVGIEGDAKIYMGRALADLDPSGVGRDLMFANDGQSSFSMFRWTAKELVERIGFSATVATLTIANLLIWFGAVVTFVRSFVTGRALALVLAAVCVLPRMYAPWHILGAGEAIPVPRPLAEAFVIFALAAMCRERYVLSFASLAVATLFHPIMAAAGAGVVLVVLGLRDWRVLAAAGLSGVAVVSAGLLGLPVVSRLFETIDPIWLGILRERNPYLFPDLWPASGFGLQIVQVATIVLATAFVTPAVRRLFLVSIAIGVLGWTVSAVAGDGFADLLVVQAQLWRALWLPAVLAPIAAGLCLWHLPTRGPLGHIALAALCVAWLMIDDVPAGPVAAVVAVAIQFGASRRSVTIGRPTVIAAWVSVVILGMTSDYSLVWVWHRVLERLPNNEARGWAYLFPLGLPIIPVLVFAAAWRTFPRSSAVRFATPVFAVLGLCALAAAWDVRTPAHRDLDAANVKPDLVALLDTRPGQVLWLDGDEIWPWARRGNWNGLTQGGSMVFSRDLAIIWRFRAQAMLDHGLTTRFMLNPWENAGDLQPVPLDPVAVADFCARPDAPSWIVSALELNTNPPKALRATIWTSNLAGWRRIVVHDDVQWVRRDRFAVIPCGPGRL